MCGIFLHLVRASSNQDYNDCLPPPSQITAEQSEFLKRRGPDCWREFSQTLANGAWQAHGASSVLHLRGPPDTCKEDKGSVAPQPVESERFILQWNGEIFQYISDTGIKASSESDAMKLLTCDPFALPENQNDTQFLFNQLSSKPSAMIPDVLNRIRGPFAVVIIDKQEDVVYFARDYFGRRSLLYRLTSESDTTVKTDDVSELAIASVTPDLGSNFQEVTSGRLYRLCLKSGSLTFSPLTDFSFKISSEIGLENEGIIENNALASENNSDSLKKQPSMDDFVDEGLKRLRASIFRRIHPIPHPRRLGILFSGGIDSTLIAASLMGIISENSSFRDYEVFLVNVAFENPSFQKACSGSAAAYDFEQVPDRQSGREAFQELQTLFPSVQSHFLARNVAFTEYEREKERITKLLQPNRTEMDLSLGLVLWFGSNALNRSTSDGSNALHRSTSDGSNALHRSTSDGSNALHRSISESPNTEDSATCSYKSKVLLCGMGADEQLGGYSRHLSAFKEGGWDALRTEMQMDLDRLGHRNLGRDDRCIADCALEGRFPFLDEELVSWLSAKVPLAVKCNLNLSPRGRGDKLIFRLMAKALGLSESVAYRPKRAMQFGAKSAKLSGSHVKGDDLFH